MIFRVTQAGASSAVTQSTTFALSSTGAGGEFYSDRNGTTAITTATIAAGDDSLVVYYRQTGGAGSQATLSAARTAGDAVATGTATISVTASTAAAARLAGEVCSATSSNRVTPSLTVASGTTCTVQAGQLVFMVFGHDADNQQQLPTIADPAGWTLLRSTDAGTAASANQLRVKVYYRVANATGSVTPSFATAANTVKVRMTF